MAWYHSGNVLSGSWPFESQRKTAQTGPFTWIEMLKKKKLIVTSSKEVMFLKQGITGGENVDTCLIALWQMWQQGCRLLYHFVPGWNISTMTGWIAMKFCADIHGSKRMKPTEFGVFPTFPIAPPLSLTFRVWSEIYQQLVVGSPWNLATICKDHRGLISITLLISRIFISHNSRLKLWLIQWNIPKSARWIGTTFWTDINGSQRMYFLMTSMIPWPSL